MNGRLASSWSLVGGALIASALMLGGCVAQAVGDEDVGEAQAALNPDPSPDGLVGVVDPGQGVILEAPTGSDPGGDPYGDPSDDDDGCEPEPNPWTPQPSWGPQQPSGGSGTPDPQQGPMSTQGQIKH
jgi:hypothetical protein